MPVVPDPDDARRRLLIDADGTTLARFELHERDGRRIADLFTLTAPPERVAAAVRDELRGWRIGADLQFGRRLVAAGARPRRHVHVLSRDLVRDPAPAAWIDPPLPDGLRLTPVDRPARDLAPACLAAYPADHPDFADMPQPDGPELELEQIMSGRLMGGPLLPCSGLAVARDGSVAGAVLVNATPGDPPFGGPWIAQLFRHPATTGAGSALLRRALGLATRDGLPVLGLAVTDANPARGLYERHGFAAVLEAFNVEV